MTELKPLAMDVKTASAYIGVCKRVIWQMLVDKKLTRLKVSNKTVIKTSELDALIESQITTFNNN